MKKRLKYLIIVVIIIIIALFYNFNRIKKANDYISLILENENITNKLQDEIIIKDDSIIYLSVDDIKSFIDKEIYIEDEIIITCSEKKVAAIELNNSTIEINGSSKKIKGQAFKTEEGKTYLPISELQNVYDTQLSYIADYKNIVIDYYSKRMEKAYTTKNVSLKEKTKIFSNTLEKIQKGNWVVYVSEENGWAKVRSQNGNIGYIKKSQLTNFVTEREDLNYITQTSSDDFLEIKVKENEIDNYKNRVKTIEGIIENAVNKKKRAVKIIFDKDEESIEQKRFKIESKAFLKECGISIIE